MKRFPLSPSFLEILSSAVSDPILRKSLNNFDIDDHFLYIPTSKIMDYPIFLGFLHAVLTPSVVDSPPK